MLCAVRSACRCTASVGCPRGSACLALSTSAPGRRHSNTHILRLSAHYGFFFVELVTPLLVQGRSDAALARSAKGRGAHIHSWRRASPRRRLLPSARTSSCVVAFVVAELLRAPSRSWTRLCRYVTMYGLWTRCRCHAPRLPAPLAHAASSAPRPSAWRPPRPRRPDAFGDIWPRSRRSPARADRP